MVQWIHDSVSGLSILFDSDTDALVASAYLEDDVIAELMDGFLDIVNTDGFDPHNASLLSFHSLLPKPISNREGILETFLRITHSPLFDVKKLTIRRSDEIDTRISEGRANATIPVYGSSAGMPMVILQGVADIFEREYYWSIFGPGALPTVFSSTHSESGSELASPRSDPLWRRPTNEHPMSARKSGKSLLSMSLVHRTWTKVAQMALRRHIVIRSGNGLASFLRNPHCGSWIKSLWISSAYRQDSFTDEEGIDWMPARLLVSLFSRAPNIIHLVVTIHSRAMSTDLDVQHKLNVQSLIIALEHRLLRNLRVLELVCNTVTRSSMLHLLRRICDLDGLSCLTFLCHSTGVEPTSEEGTISVGSASIANLLPPPSLKTLQVTLTAVEFQLETVKWFIRPRDGYALENVHFDLTLALTPDKDFIHDHLVSCCEIGVPSLQRFSIGESQNFSAKHLPSSTMERKYLLEILFPNIRCFRLGPVYSETISPFLRNGMRLPSSIEEVEIVFRADRLSMRESVKWDVDLCALITERRLPQLRKMKLIFTNVPKPGPDARDPSVSFNADERFSLLFGLCSSGGTGSLDIEARYYGEIVDYNDTVQTFFLDSS
ncbi:hypothetical protein SCHPADRAFT_575281 [Schizopora paradoxa]|uniref:Uncharacterized protein n=1 Tax=Schizopora paradoxa TaxID=27342 RepID=A0A0H2RCK1_9AGAM|nr:hypothetical protein SCHPADRAFT_575281 [Schizopora paradoxa]